MIDQDFQRRAEEFRAKALHARSEIVRNWAASCANILEEQATFLERTGRCPDVPLPDRPGAYR